MLTLDASYIRWAIGTLETEPCQDAVGVRDLAPYVKPVLHGTHERRATMTGVMLFILVGFILVAVVLTEFDDYR